MHKYDYLEGFGEKTSITEDHIANGIIFPEKKERVYPICKSCESFIKLTKFCRECKCFMPMKTLLKDTKCPLGKW
jgi:hypothetical protein